MSSSQKEKKKLVLVWGDECAISLTVMIFSSNVSNIKLYTLNKMQSLFVNLTSTRLEKKK